MKDFRSIDYMNHPEERKKVANLLQKGNLRKVSTRPKTENNVRKNRLIMLIFAFFVFITGLCSIFF